METVTFYFNFYSDLFLLRCTVYLFTLRYQTQALIKIESLTTWGVKIYTQEKSSSIAFKIKSLYLITVKSISNILLLFREKCFNVFTGFRLLEFKFLFTSL